jgi:hypothetical protein
VDNDNFDTLLNELSSFEIPANQLATSEKAQDRTLQESDVDQYVLNKSKAIIDAGVSAVQDMTPYIVQGQDAREIDALSKLVAATAQAIDTLNKKSLINQKAAKDEQLEKIKIEGRKEIVQMQQTNPKNITTNNVLIASREDIMKQISSSNSEVLEIEDK